ncbi:MAG: hypothetical protein HXM12_03540 [Fusobacterium periodonticum]|nr:hypothetical protein [Fusobacterium periodonticum]
MKKDIDFDKILKETLEEYINSLVSKNEDETVKTHIKSMAIVSSHICSNMLKKYHQELLED